MVIPSRNCAKDKWQIAYVCVHGYQKLNAQTKKDPFLLPFLDLVLDSVAKHEMYSFINGYSNYNQCWADINFFSIHWFMLSDNSNYLTILVIIFL
jgi:hypothetical protein